MKLVTEALQHDFHSAEACHAHLTAIHYRKHGLMRCTQCESELRLGRAGKMVNAFSRKIHNQREHIKRIEAKLKSTPNGVAATPASTARTDGNRYWDIFTADDGGRLLRLCWRKNDAGNFMAMEVAELVTWNNAAEQKEAEESMLQMLNIAEKNREWLRKRADGEDKPLPAAPGSVPQAAQTDYDPCCDECGMNFSEHDGKDHEGGACANFTSSVPQAEPPKEEKL